MGGVTLAIQAYSINVGWHWQTTVFTTLASSSSGTATAATRDRDGRLRRACSGRPGRAHADRA
jgi:hypothetical protein